MKSIDYKNVLDKVCNDKPTLDVYIEEFKVLQDFTSVTIYRGNMITIASTIANMIIDIVSVISQLIEYRNKRKSQNMVIPIK